jgi:hypothetical protein
MASGYHGAPMPGAWKRDGRRASCRPVLAAIFLASCRQGGIAGAGAHCTGDESCRAGYRCLAGACSALEPEQDAEQDAAPGAPPLADAAPGDTASPQEATAPDAAEMPGEPPSLRICTEYIASGPATECDRTRTLGARPERAGFSPDGQRYLTSGGEPPVSILWRINGHVFAPQPPPLPFDGNNVVFSPDGRLFAADRPVSGLFDMETRQMTTMVPAPAGAGARMVGFSSDGQRLAMLSATTLRLFSLAKKQTRDVDVQSTPFLAREPSLDTADGWWVAYGSVATGSYRIMFIDLDLAMPKPVLGMATVYGPTQAPRLTLTTDAKLGALSDGAGVGLWDLADKAAPRKLALVRPPEAGPMDDIPDLAFSPSGRYLVVGVARAHLTGEVVIYDVSTRQQIAGRQLGGPAHRVSFSPDGRAIAVAIRECATVLYCRD